MTAGDAAYWRAYRRRRREEGRPIRRGPRSRRLEPGEITLTDALMILVAAETDRIGVRGFARAILIDHGAISRWMTGDRVVGAFESVDALVAYFGWRRVSDVRAAARRILREDPADATFSSVRLTPPGPFLPREVRSERRHPWRTS